LHLLDGSTVTLIRKTRIRLETENMKRIVKWVNSFLDLLADLVIAHPNAAIALLIVLGIFITIGVFVLWSQTL
jgi:hypothetical protein